MRRGLARESLTFLRQILRYSPARRSRLRRLEIPQRFLQLANKSFDAAREE